MIFDDIADSVRRCKSAEESPVLFVRRLGETKEICSILDQLMTGEITAIVINEGKVPDRKASDDEVLEWLRQRIKNDEWRTLIKGDHHWLETHVSWTSRVP
jgi:hypothetical protein